MIYDTIEQQGYICRINYDEYPESPREWENIGKIIVPRYCRYFESEYEFDFSGDAENDKKELRKLGAKIIFPLYILDHSLVAVSLHPFHDTWDSGQVGWYAAFDLQGMKENHAAAAMSEEIEILDDYFSGSVYGCEFLSVDNPEIVDFSCWGYFGDNGINQIKEEFSAWIRNLEKKDIPLGVFA